MQPNPIQSPLMPRKTLTPGHGNKAFRSKKNYCFACGKDNPDGMHLKFTLDQERQRFVSHFRLSKRYTGPPGYCHGGIIATILDDAMGQLCKLRQVVAVTSKMSVEYLRPVPLYRPLRVQSRELTKRGRRLTHIAELLGDDVRIHAPSN